MAKAQKDLKLLHHVPTERNRNQGITFKNQKEGLIKSIFLQPPNKGICEPNLFQNFIFSYEDVPRYHFAASS